MISNPVSSDKTKRKSKRVSLDEILMDVSPQALLAVRDGEIDWHHVHQSISQKQEEKHSSEEYNQCVYNATHHSTCDERTSYKDIERTLEQRKEDQGKEKHSCQCASCGSRKGRSWMFAHGNCVADTFPHIH